MEPWHWAIVLKPLGLIVLFGAAYMGARFIGKNLPEGRLKSILFFSWKV